MLFDCFFMDFVSYYLLDQRIESFDCLLSNTAWRFLSERHLE